MKIIPKTIEKLALEIQEPGRGPLRHVADTYGRLQAAPGAVLIGQEQAGKWLRGPQKADVEEQAEVMDGTFGDELRDVKVRYGGPDLIDDVKRVWGNDRTYLPQKLLHTIASPLSSLGASLTRADHYNPMTNVAQIYSGIPQVTGHELGHAVDFNKKGPFARAAYGMAGAIERGPNMLGFPGPVTHWMELQANRNYLKALGMNEDAGAADQNKREAWRRLLPAYATYGMATGMGGLYMHHRNAGGGADTPYSKLTGGARDLSQQILEKVTDSDSARQWAPTVASLGLLGTATAGGRLVAELRNALTKRPKPKPKPTDKQPSKEAAVIDLVKIALDPAAASGEPTAPLNDQQNGMMIPALAGALTPALALGGAALGAASAPSVYGTQGAGRGALYGGGLGIGAGLGGMLGNQMGGGKGSIIGALAGGGLGMLGARGIMGRHPREKDREATEARQRMKAEEKARAKMASVNRLARLLCD